MDAYAPTSIGLIIKATRSCNLRCSYCGDWRPGSANAMPFDVLAKLIHAALQDVNHRSVRFTWHGGEPTLLPREFFVKAMVLQHRFRQPGQRITNAIMTNATRIDDAWAEFIKANEFTVGVSLDGPPEIHDRYRVDAAGRPSFDNVRRGMRVLRDYGIDFGVTVVLDEAGYAYGPERLFDFLVGEGISSFGINFVMPAIGLPPDRARNHYITPQRRTQFLIGLYERWRAHGDRTIRVRELDGLRSRVVGQDATPCTLSGSCWGSLYSIEPNGDVCHCDFFLGDQSYVWGNVLTHSFGDIRRSAAMADAQARHRPGRQAKAACPEFAVCQGGCPHEYLMSERLNPDHVTQCCGLRDLIEEIRADGIRDPVLLGEPGFAR
jgi:uncharacterized protein